MGASAYEAQTGWFVVEVVVLLAVGEQLAREDQVGQLVAAARRLRVLALHAIQIAVEDARVALVAQQDQRVGQRLEEALDRRRHRLARLRVVVHHHRHGRVRLGLHERLVKHLSQIAIFRCRDLAEVVEEGCVVQAELVVHLIEVLEQFVHVADPELAHEEQFALAEVLFEVCHELVGEALGEVLACIEAESAELELLDHPLAPVDHVVDDFRVAVIDVGEHEEVGVAGLVAYAVRPVFVVAQDPVDARLIVPGIVVCA